VTQLQSIRSIMCIRVQRWGDDVAIGAEPFEAIAGR